MRIMSTSNDWFVPGLKRGGHVAMETESASETRNLMKPMVEKPGKYYRKVFGAPDNRFRMRITV